MIAAFTRSMTVAGVALLLAGCNVTTVENKVEAPTAMSGTLYVGAPARSRPLPPPARWASECSPSRFQDSPVCAVSVRFFDVQADVWGSLVSLDEGRSWWIIGDPYPTSFQLRVDRHPVIAARCHGNVGYCRVPPAPGGTALTEQLKGGRKLALQVVTNGGEFDQDFSILGFREALAEVRATGGIARPDPAVKPAKAR